MYPYGMLSQSPGFGMLNNPMGAYGQQMPGMPGQPAQGGTPYGVPLQNAAPNISPPQMGTPQMGGMQGGMMGGMRPQMPMGAAMPGQPGQQQNPGMGILQSYMSNPAQMQQLMQMLKGGQNGASGPWNQGNYNVVPGAGQMMYDPSTGGSSGLAGALGNFNY